MKNILLIFFVMGCVVFGACDDNRITEITSNSSIEDDARSHVNLIYKFIKSENGEYNAADFQRDYNRQRERLFEKYPESSSGDNMHQFRKVADKYAKKKGYRDFLDLEKNMYLKLKAANLVEGFKHDIDKIYSK